MLEAHDRIFIISAQYGENKIILGFMHTKESFLSIATLKKALNNLDFWALLKWKEKKGFTYYLNFLSLLKNKTHHCIIIIIQSGSICSALHNCVCFVKLGAFNSRGVSRCWYVKLKTLLQQHCSENGNI